MGDSGLPLELSYFVQMIWQKKDKNLYMYKADRDIPQGMSCNYNEVEHNAQEPQVRNEKQSQTQVDSQWQAMDKL